MDKSRRDHARDVQDVGRVIAALLGDMHSDPVAIAAKYADPDLTKIFCSTTMPVQIQNLTGLELHNGARILKGGGGIVFQCVNQEIPELKYALKVTRPSLFTGTLKKAGEVLSQSTGEYLKHAPLSHQNVARVFGAGNLNVRLATKGVELPLRPVLMEWIEGAKPLSDYLIDSSNSWREVVEIIAQVFDGLQHLHSRCLIHWDVKSDNVQVDHSGIPKIVDIGNARRSDIFSVEKALSTRRNVPPELLRLQNCAPSKRADSSRRTPLVVPGPEWDAPWLDMWMLAREVNRIFAADRATLALDASDSKGQVVIAERARFLGRVFPSEDAEARYAFGYIALVIRRLLSSGTPTGQYCYREAAPVAQALRNLFPPFGDAQSVEELQAVPQKVLRLPHSGNAPYTKRFSQLYNSSLVRRTTRHLQLGTLTQVYPGGCHRRSEHTAGVVATTVQYVRALFANRTEPSWRFGVTRADVDALLLAALLHDVGHMCLGHALEEMEGLFAGRFHEDYALALLKAEDASPAVRADRTELRRLLSDYWMQPGADLDAFVNTVRDILSPPDRPNLELRDGSDGLDSPAWAAWLKLRLLHSILNSAIDADKLDYLLRDAHHCGVKYAEGVDVDRFFQALSPIVLPQAEGRPLDACIGMHWRQRKGNSTR